MTHVFLRLFHDFVGHNPRFSSGDMSGCDPVRGCSCGSQGPCGTGKEGQVKKWDQHHYHTNAPTFGGGSFCVTTILSLTPTISFPCPTAELTSLDSISCLKVLKLGLHVIDTFTASQATDDAYGFMFVPGRSKYSEFGMNNVLHGFMVLKNVCVVIQHS